MAETLNNFNYDEAIKNLKAEKIKHEKEEQYMEYAKEVSFVQSAYFTELQGFGFTREEALELLKIWSSVVLKK